MAKPAIERVPLTYTDEELLALANEVQALKSHPVWLTLGRILQDAIVATQNEGFQHLDEIQRWAGQADGLRLAWQLPNDILTAADRVLKNEQARKEKPAASPKKRRLDPDDDLTL